MFFCVNDRAVYVDLQAIRTSGRTYQAQFDLMKDVRVKISTLLNGPCTNNKLIESDYTEKVLEPPATGQFQRLYTVDGGKK